MKNKSLPVGRQGFTLIELLVVIAIIGILASVVLVSLNSARAKSRDAKRKQDLTQIRSALEMYYNDYGSYPVTTNGYRSHCPGYGGFDVTGANGYIPNLAPAYIPTLPLDPKPIDPYGCYLYRSDGIDYKVLVHGTIESIACPPTPQSFGFYEPTRAAIQCTMGIYTPGGITW